MFGANAPVVAPNPHLTTDHTAVSKIVMYIIAVTFVLCDVLVLLAKGVDAMPFGIYGLIGSLVFIVAALADGAVRQAPAALSSRPPTFHAAR